MTRLPTPEEQNQDLNLGMESVAQEEKGNYAVRLKNGKCTEESVLPKSLVSPRTGAGGRGIGKSRSTISKCFETWANCVGAHIQNKKLLLLILRKSRWLSTVPEIRKNK